MRVALLTLLRNYAKIMLVFVIMLLVKITLFKKHGMRAVNMGVQRAFTGPQ